MKIEFILRWNLLAFLNIKCWIANEAYNKISNISVCETEIKFRKHCNTLPDMTSRKRDGFAVLTPLAGLKNATFLPIKMLFIKLEIYILCKSYNQSELLKAV